MEQQLAAEKASKVEMETKLNAAVSDENKLNSLKAENNILKQTLAGNAKSVEKVKELTEEVNKLKEQVKAAEDAKSELEAQNNKNELDAYIEKIESLENEVKSSNEKFTELESEHQKTVTDLLTKEASAAAELNEQLSKAQSQNEELQSQLVDLQKQVQTAAEEKESLNVQVEELNQKVNEGPQIDTAEFEAAQNEVASLKEQLAKSSSDLEELKEKNNKGAVTEVQSSVRTRLSAAFPDVQAEGFDDFVAAVAESASKSTGDNEENTKLQQELGEAKESESRLSNQVRALQQSLDGALQRNKTLEADLSDREETIVAKENAADSYSLILQSAESDMKRIQEEAATQ